MTTPGNYPTGNLRAVSPELGNTLAADFTTITNDLASLHVGRIVRGFETSQRNAAVGDKMARWNEWSTRIIDPVMASPRANIDTHTGLGDNPVRTRLSVPVPLANGRYTYPATMDLRISHHDDVVADAYTIAESDEETARELVRHNANGSIWEPDQQTLDIALRTGTRTGLGQISNGRFRGAREVTTVPVRALRDNAELRKQSIIPLLNPSAINFSVEETGMRGRVEPPIPSHLPDPLYNQRISAERIMEKLDENHRIAAAEGRLHPNDVLSLAMQDIVNMAHTEASAGDVADEAIQMIVTSPRFRDLTR